MEERVDTFDWNSLKNLVPLCIKTANQYKNKENIDLSNLASQISSELGIDINEYAKNNAENAIANKLDPVLGKENSDTLVGLFDVACVPIMTAVYNYAKGNTDSFHFSSCLNDINADLSNQLTQSFASQFNLPPEKVNIVGEKIGPYAVTIICFTEAFKIYRIAANDARIATERRIEAERLSQEAISQLQEKRQEMERILERSLLGKLISFEKCISSMDQAIINNDDDDFIASNTELWELFGREKQYRNAKEFDDLMLSDEAFIL